MEIKVCQNKAAADFPVINKFLRKMSRDIRVKIAIPDSVGNWSMGEEVSILEVLADSIKGMKNIDNVFPLDSYEDNLREELCAANLESEHNLKRYLDLYQKSTREAIEKKLGGGGLMGADNIQDFPAQSKLLSFLFFFDFF
jgi:hypothetical protein